MDDNIFDDDDALDYIIYKDCEKSVNSTNFAKGDGGGSGGGSGCLGIILGLIVVPPAGFVLWQIIQTVMV